MTLSGTGHAKELASVRLRYEYCLREGWRPQPLRSLIFDHTGQVPLTRASRLLLNVVEYLEGLEMPWDSWKLSLFAAFLSNFEPPSYSVRRRGEIDTLAGFLIGSCVWPAVSGLLCTRTRLLDLSRADHKTVTGYCSGCPACLMSSYGRTETSISKIHLNLHHGSC